jgi:hypothetical protein
LVDEIEVSENKEALIVLAGNSVSIHRDRLDSALLKNKVNKQ